MVDPKSFIPGTDNLNKFLALVGMIMIIASAWIFLLKLYDLRIMMVDLNAEVSLEEIRISGIKEPEARRLAQEVNKRKLLLGARKTTIIAQQVVHIRRAAIVCLAVGLLLMITGFRRWHRLQGLEDQILRRQALGAEPMPEEAFYRIARRRIPVWIVTTTIMILTLASVLLYVAERLFWPRLVLLAVGAVLGLFRLIRRQGERPRITRSRVTTPPDSTAPEDY